MVDALLYVLALYAALAASKTLLMYGTMPTAVGVHYRMRTRMGQNVTKLNIFLYLSMVIPFIALLSVPISLREEGWRYFSVYSRRQTMRDILFAYR